MVREAACGESVSGAMQLGLETWAWERFEIDGYHSTQ
jgi:hypothetical protein